MTNPYSLLNVKQDITNNDLKRALVKAIKLARTNEFSASEIMAAEKTLRDPAKRLAADFMFPSKIKAKRPVLFAVNEDIETIDLDRIDSDALDSLSL
jgi:hypothetical protein